MRAHVLLLIASWIAFSALLGIWGAFEQMETGGKEVVSAAMVQAVGTTVVILLIGLMIGAVPVWFLLKRLNTQA